MESPQLSKFRLNRPFNQNFLMGCILFCLPGIYLALTGLGAGGGGPAALEVAITANAILYGIFTICGWLAGAVLNLLRPRLTIMLGCVGYPLYVGGLWYFDRVGLRWFPYFGGAILGVTAGLLWTGGGYIAYAYAEEKDKGKYIAIQWAMTSLGGTVGALIAFGVSVNEDTVTGVSNGVYVAFVVIMCVAMVASGFLIKDPATIVRDDGTHLAEFAPSNLKAELANLKYMVTDWRIYVLMPSIFVAEMCLSTVSSINSYYFSLRARTLNNVLFQFIMVLSALGISFILDFEKMTRRKRGFIACSGVGVVVMGALAGQVGWMRVNNLDGRLTTPPDVDWTDSRFAAGVVLYLLWGIVLATYLCCALWVVGTLSNDPARCAMYAGFTKGTASFGLCVCFIMDIRGVTYMTQTIVQFVLYGIGALAMIYIVLYQVTDTNYFVEEGVIVPTHVKDEMAMAHHPSAESETVAEETFIETKSETKSG